jgi:ABC-2 type transport system permease protein
MRLKLRLLANSFRGAGWRLALAILGVLGGVWFSFVGFGFFTLSAILDARDAYTLAVLGGSALVVGWTTLPLMVFGVDETLDPVRFALLPLRRVVLLRGLFAAALLGIPAVMTLIATQGLVVGAVRWGGAAAGLAAFAGTLLGLLMCVAVSRAVTSAMATALRSRRARDAAVVLLALLAGGLGPLQFAGISVVQTVGAERLAAAARVVAWTPVGAPYAVGLDVAAGRWGVAAARFGLTAAAVALLLRWWAVTLPAALRLAPGAAGPRTRTTDLVPVGLRRLPPGLLVGLMAREWRYWWRDPRRRSALVSALMVALVLPVVFVSIGAFGLPFALVLAGALIGSLLANQIGMDGSAYATHLLAGVPGRTELTARIAVVTGVTFPLVIVVAIGAGAIGGDSRAARAIGLAFLAYGAAAALATILTVVIPYALPESTNPFALSTGTGGVRGLASFGPMLLGSALAAPLAVLGLPDALVLLIGLLAGGALLVAGVLIAGNVLDERGPEVLLAVTPRR